VEVDIIRG